MLLPCGRCYHHLLLCYCKIMAGVMAMWQMEKPLTWSYIYVMADVIADVILYVVNRQKLDY